MRNVRGLLALALKAVALGMAALAIVFILAGFATLEPYIIVLAIGLFSLAVASLMEHPL